MIVGICVGRVVGFKLGTLLGTVVGELDGTRVGLTACMQRNTSLESQSRPELEPNQGLILKTQSCIVLFGPCFKTGGLTNHHMSLAEGLRIDTCLGQQHSKAAVS